MRIAILNWRDRAHPASGGAEVFIEEIARCWINSGHSVTICSSRADGLKRRENEAGIEIVRVGKLKSGSHHLLAPGMVERHIKPDIVLESVNTIPYLLPLRRRMPPYVSLVHQMARDIWAEHLPNPLAAVARYLEPWLYRPYRRVPLVAVSESTKQDLKAIGVRSVDVVPQGGLGTCTPTEKDANPTFLFVGRFTRNKRPAHVLEAFRHIKTEIPHARLWMIGVGELRDELDRDLPNGAEILGRLDRGDLLERMGRAHLLLVTSVREGWGLVVTEANAMGTPAVAYDVPGLRDSVVSGKTGLLVAQKPSVMAAAAIALIQNPSRYEQVRQSALEWGASCSWDRTAEYLLEQLISKSVSTSADPPEPAESAS